MRLPLLAIAMAGLLCSTSAMGQVATMDLVPASYRTHFYAFPGYDSATITPDNPAALAWARSLAAVGSVDENFENPIGAAIPVDGSYAGLRLVGSRWSFALEYVSLLDSAGIRENKIDNEHVAFKLTDGWSIGIGREKNHITIPSPNFVETVKTLYGTTLRLGDTVYVGLGVATDKYENDAAVTADRSASMYGIAWQPKADWKWHLSYDHLDYNDFYDSIGTNLGYGFKADLYALQVNAHGLLLGMGWATPGQPTFDTEVPTRTYDLGWVPEGSGFTALARISEAETRAAGVAFAKDRTVSVSVGYLF